MTIEIDGKSATVPTLVVDDDPRVRMLVRVNLEARGYAVQEASTGGEAIAMLEQTIPSLIILDLVMPGMGGDEVCLWIRERSDVPVIVLSAHNEEDLKVRALDAGADDYVTKPFAQEEFMARIRAVMRRVAIPSPKDDNGTINLRGLSINLKARRAFVNDKDMRLTRTEFALLAQLAQNLDSILTHDELLARVWGEEYRGSSHYLHVYFGRIRKKMGDAHSNLLESVPGIGYVLHAAP
jgi:two-component system, OmpR family, KDP operon response regulator KdpE